MRTIINSTRLLCLAIAGILLFSCSDNFDEFETPKQTMANAADIPVEASALSPINIPDAAFKAYLLKMFGKPANGQITSQDARLIAVIDCSNMSPKIKSMQGIEHFINLTVLDCSNNSIESLDISRLSWLRELKCNDNILKSLDVSSNSKLSYLDCSYQVVQLSLAVNSMSGGRPIPIRLHYMTTMTSLKLGTLKELEFLHCSITGISELNIKGCNNLKYLYCSNNNIKELYLNYMHNLEYVDLSLNYITRLDLPNAPPLLTITDSKMRELNIKFNELPPFLTFRGFPYLEKIDCTNNPSLSFIQIEYGSKVVITKDSNTSVYYFQPGPRDPWAI